MLIDETFRNCFCSPGKASDAPGHEQTGLSTSCSSFG